LGSGQAVVIVGVTAGGGTTGAALMTTEQASVPVCAGPLVSATATVKFAVPCVVGVPESVPLEESNKPAGSAPAVCA